MQSFIIIIVAQSEWTVAPLRDPWRSQSSIAYRQRYSVGIYLDIVGPYVSRAARRSSPAELAFGFPASYGLKDEIQDVNYVTV